MAADVDVVGERLVPERVSGARRDRLADLDRRFDILAGDGGECLEAKGGQGFVNLLEDFAALGVFEIEPDGAFVAAVGSRAL